jgi:hypothetical protein
MKTPIQTLAAIALSALILTACNPNLRRPDVTRVDPKTGEVSTRTDAREIEAGLLQAFPDVPIPAGHKIDLERSMIFNSPSQTVGKLTAEGSGDVDSVYRFYQAKMQENGWNLVNAFQSATSSLYYAKPGKFLAIIIEATGRRSTRVTLNVGPE